MATAELSGIQAGYNRSESSQRRRCDLMSVSIRTDSTWTATGCGGIRDLAHKAITETLAWISESPGSEPSMSS
jgi:hypothetical protein